MTPSTLLTMSPALAAVFGSLAGAMGSSVSSWITQRYADRRDLLARRIFHPEQLYSDFISESANTLVDALESSFKEPHKLTPAYALMSRIRPSSSKDILASAERLVREIIAIYSEPDLTAEQIRSRALNGKDPLKQLSEICRAELDTMRGRL